MTELMGKSPRVVWCEGRVGGGWDGDGWLCEWTDGIEGTLGGYGGMKRGGRGGGEEREREGEGERGCC